MPRYEGIFSTKSDTALYESRRNHFCIWQRFNRLLPMQRDYTIKGEKTSGAELIRFLMMLLSSRGKSI
jgi:hypothetical protein